jgi:hypothetical protein
MCSYSSKPPTVCQCGMELSVHHVTESVEQPDDGADDALTDEQLEQRRQLQVQLIAKKMMAQQSTMAQPIAWDPEQHSVQAEPDSYGTICFEGFGHEASRKAPVSLRC